jgi:hypothetical protein
MVGAVEREIPQRRELRLRVVWPGRIRRCITIFNFRGYRIAWQAASRMSQSRLPIIPGALVQVVRERDEGAVLVAAESQVLQLPSLGR